MQVQLKKVRPSQVMAQVVEKVMVTPLMVRLTLGGFGMSSFLQVEGVDAPAAWVKVFPANREGRAYTVRHINMLTGTLDIEFVLHGDDAHDDGSVSAWARDVTVGESVEIAGPRSGGFMLDPASTWVWLNADASALPAVHSILASLPGNLDVVAAVQVANAQEAQLLETNARLHTIWLYADASAADKEAALFDVDKTASQLTGTGQVWGAGEHADIKSWRNFWLQDKGIDRQQLVVKGYWKQGEKDFKDKTPLAA